MFCPSKKLLLLSTLLGALLLSSVPASAVAAGAIESLPGCGANDGPVDGGVPPTGALGFTAGFFGTTASSVSVNEDGNVTFDGPRNDFAPVDLATASDVMIAPFLADANASAHAIKFGNGVKDDGITKYFCVDWNSVPGWDSSPGDDTFQLLLTQTPAQAAHHDFTIEFNYESIAWNTSGGVAGTPATAGFSAGNGVPGSAYAMAGSAALVTGSHGTTVPGRYVFPIVNRPIGGGRLHGWVYESDGSTFAPYTPVKICPSAGGACTTRSANNVGEYVAAGLAPGVYALSASDGSDTGTTRVTVTCGDNAAPDLVLGESTPPGATPRPACPPPPAAGKPTPTLPPAVPHVDARAALSAQMTALVRRMARGLRAGRRSFVVPFQAAAPGAATLAITRGRTRVAVGRLTTARAGAVKITVRVTRKGRALLRRHKRLRLRLAVAFAPRGGAAVRVTRSFSVRPR